MANKKERPAIENPLANMGLDEIVRGITTNEAKQEKPVIKVKEPKKRNAMNFFHSYLTHSILPPSF